MILTNWVLFFFKAIVFVRFPRRNFGPKCGFKSVTGPLTRIACHFIRSTETGGKHNDTHTHTNRHRHTRSLRKETFQRKVAGRRRRKSPLFRSSSFCFSFFFGHSFARKRKLKAKLTNPPPPQSAPWLRLFKPVPNRVEPAFPSGFTMFQWSSKDYLVLDEVLPGLTGTYRV